MNDSYAEEIELDYRQRDGPDASLLASLPRASTESLTSAVFAQIQQFAKVPRPSEDIFLADPLYQDEFVRYHNTARPTKWSRFINLIPGKGRTMASLCAAMLIALWAIGLLVFTQSKALKSVIPHALNTNLSMNGYNITLAPYSHDSKNFTMSEWRRGTLTTSKMRVDWLDTPQYPTTPNGGGYYQTNTVADACVILQLGTDFRQTVIKGQYVDFRNHQYRIELVTLNPATAYDDVHGSDIVTTNVTSQFRSLSSSLYWIYNRKTAEYSAIRPQVENSDPLVKLHFAKFSPKGDLIIFGHNHDLYIQDIATSEVVRITDTGSPDIFNGVPDWVYEEEVMRQDTMLWWSPDQEKLVFASIDDTKVKSIDISYFASSPVDLDTLGAPLNIDVEQYPTKSSIKYPKPGTNNPVVSLFRYDVQSRTLRPIEMPQKLLGDDLILYDAVWVDSDSLMVKASDRTSTILVKGVYAPKKHDEGIRKISSYNALEEYGGWVETAQPIQIIPRDGFNLYIDRVIVNGRSHLAMFENAWSPLYQNLLTNSSQWDIQEQAPLVYDANENFIFTLATIRSSMDAHLIAIDLLLPQSQVKEITSTEADGLYEINFSRDGQYLDLIYSGPSQPWQRLINVADMHDVLKDRASAEKLTALISLHKAVNNFEKTRDLRKQYNLPTKSFRTVSIAKDNIGLNVVEILPPNFDPARKKYPLMVSTYGGPGFQNIYKRDEIGFHEMVSLSLDVIVLIIDPRGTGGQGWPFKSYAKDKIGYWEARDIVTVVSDYIKVNRKSIDTERTALWGWSYGGFATLKTLEYDAGEFIKYGVAVAPVTNWLFYDSIYTERYMGSPRENPNYDKTAKIQDYDLFKGVSRFMIMHGTADDNVHIQNLLWLLDNLNMKGVENYDVHFFPDSDHSIDYHNANSILFDRLYTWLKDAFTGKFDEL